MNFDDSLLKLNYSKEGFKAILRLIPNPIYVWKQVDNDLILIEYNEAAVDITEGKIKNVIGVKASEFYREQLNILDDLNRCIKENVKISRELKYTFKTTGKKKVLNVTYNFVPPDMIFVYTEDISEKRESEEKYRFFFKNFRGIAYQGTLYFVPLFFHGAVMDITGYTEEEFKSGNPRWDEVIHPEDLHKISDEDIDSIRKTPNYMKEREYRIIKKDGKIRWVYEIIQNISDENGIPYLVQGEIYDITERKKAEDALKDSERSLAKGQEIGNFGSWEWDISQNVTKWSDNLYRIFGVTHELFDPNAYEKFLELIHPNDQENVAKIIEQAIKDKKPFEIEYKIVRPNQEIRYINAKGRATTDKVGKLKMIGTSQDITKRNLAEQKLKDSEEKYREAYNRSNLYKDIFTHDISNILQNILSSAGLSKLYSNDNSNKENFDEVTNIISEQVIRGKSLVSNVQKLSEIEEENIPKLPIEAFSILKKASEFIKESFSHKNINIDMESFQNEYYVIANQFLNNIFENILFNAVKHNRNQNIDILIRISKYGKKGIPFIKFEFLDNGIGIPDSMKHEIFRREYKKNEEPSGIGLGLLLVKRIIENYHGEIMVKNKIQGDYTKGSNFIILIPESI